MAWRGRGRRPPGGFSRHDITLKDDDSSDVPQNFPPVNNMPARAPAMEQMDPETQRLLVRTAARTRSKMWWSLSMPPCLATCLPCACAPADATPCASQSLATAEWCSHETLPMCFQSRYNKMRLAFHESPFHMDKEAQAAHDGTQPAVQTFVDVQQDAKKQQTKSKAALHQVRRTHIQYCGAGFRPRQGTVPCVHCMPMRSCHHSWCMIMHNV